MFEVNVLLIILNELIDVYLTPPIVRITSHSITAANDAAAGDFNPAIMTLPVEKTKKTQGGFRKRPTPDANALGGAIINKHVLDNASTLIN